MAAVIISLSLLNLALITALIFVAIATGKQNSVLSSKYSTYALVAVGISLFISLAISLFMMISRASVLLAVSCGVIALILIPVIVLLWRAIYNIKQRDMVGWATGLISLALLLSLGTLVSSIIYPVYISMETEPEYARFLRAREQRQYSPPESPQLSPEEQEFLARKAVRSLNQ